MTINIEMMENALAVWNADQNHVLVEVIENEKEYQVCIDGQIIKRISKKQ